MIYHKDRMMMNARLNAIGCARGVREGDKCTNKGIVVKGLMPGR